MTANYRSLVVGLVLLCDAGTLVAQEVPKTGTGVFLVGRSDKEPPLYRWSLVDAKTKKAVSTVDNRWGFTAVPPGDYELLVKKYEVDVPYGIVYVTKDKVTRVEVKAGVDVVGRSDNEEPLYRWSVVDAKTKKQVTHVDRRWGFTPVPPGAYELWVKKHEVDLPYAKVHVSKDKAVRVDIKTGVEVLGRSDKEPTLHRWSVVDPKTKESVTHVDNRWGFTPVPPGEYTLQIRPQHSEALNWGAVKVAPASITSVKVASGIDLSPRTPNEKPPKHWFVYDLNKREKPIVEVRQRWGMSFLPPGEYGVTDQRGSYPLLKVKVAPEQIVQVQFPELAQRLAAVTGVGRKTEKERDPVKFKKLEEEIELAIRRGAAWLKKHSLLVQKQINLHDEYATLGVLALLHAGEFERDPVLAEKCLDYLLRRPLDRGGTYATALTAMALADMDPYGHARRILECAQWLVENQGWDAKRKVWGYGDRVPGIGELKKERITTVTPVSLGKELEVRRRGLLTKPQRPEYWDNSCSQFAVLGLHSATHAGIKLPRDSWARIESHFREVHASEEGGWSYYGSRNCTGSMTCAGIASLLLARYHLGEKTPMLDAALVSGLEWIAGHLTYEKNPKDRSDHYYSLYGLERVGVLAGTEFLGDHEWYPEGARYLLANQRPDGSWQSKTGPPTGGHDTYQDTCYAILFLRRATLPPAPPKPGMIEVVYEQPKLPPPIVPNVELVLDCSGSMEEKVVGNEDRITVARRVMDKLITEIPDGFNVGFRIFGAQGFWDWRTKGQAPDNHPGWNTDTQLLVPMGPLGEGTRREEMRKWISSIECKGATPLVYALLQARKDFHAGMKGPKTVVLISDGLENCGGKMEDVEKAYKDAGIDLVIHVVGFAITEKEHKVLELLAKWTKGNYYRADDAGQLAKALKDAAGSLQYVVQSEGGRVVAQGQLNGPGVALKAGNYQVSIQGIRETPLVLRVESEQRLRLTLDNAGKLIVADKK